MDARLQDDGRRRWVRWAPFCCWEEETRLELELALLREDMRTAEAAVTPLLEREEARGKGGGRDRSLGSCWC